MDTIRKNERKNWYYSYNLIFELEISIYAKMVYKYLCRCADGDGHAFPSLNDIAKKCSIKSRQTVITAIKELEGARLLSKERRLRENKSQTSTMYTVYHSPYERAQESCQPNATHAPSAETEVTPLYAEKVSPVHMVDSPCPYGGQPLSTGKTAPVHMVDSPCPYGGPPEGLPSEGLPSEGLPSEGTRAREETNSTVLKENGFKQFWNAYPKKTGRQTSQVVWNQYNPTPELLSRIMTFLSKEKASRQWQTEGGRYIPKPENWLSQRRWEEEQGLTQDMIDAKYLVEPDFLALYGKGGVARGKNPVHPRDAPST